MKKLSELTIKLNKLIIAIVLLLTVFFGYQLKDVSINSDIISFLPDNDPVAKLYKEIGNKYGSNNMAMVVLETDNIYSAQVLEHIKQITDTLKITDGIGSVTSLTDIMDIKNSDFGIEIGKLVDEYDLPKTKEQLDSLKSYIDTKPMYKGAIVSEDATATLIMCNISEGADSQNVANNIKKKVKKMGLPETIYFGGMPMVMNDTSDLILADIIWLIPLVFILITLILFLSFKSLKGVVLPLLTSGIAIVWAIGLMQLCGYELTMVSNNIPIILLAVGSAYTIHVLNRIIQQKDDNPKKALVNAVAYITVPVALAAVTTSIGFVSFVFGAYLTMIKDFGIFTSLGTLFALFLAVFFVPALLSLFAGKARKERTVDAKKQSNFISDKILQPLVNLLFKHPKYTITGWTLVILLSISGIFMIKTSVDINEYFKEGNETRVSEDIMQKKFGGSMPVFVIFKGDLQSPEVLKKMKEAEEYMKKSPNISTAQSVADLIEQMNDVMGEGKKIPDDRDKIEQLWFLLDGQNIMEQLVSFDLDEGVIQARFASSDSKIMEKFNNYMRKYIAENTSEDYQISFTGMPSIYEQMNNSLIKSQAGSLIIAVLLVLVIVGLILKSFLKGIYATVPIISTIVVLFGFMGIAGIALDIATVLVASVALGIGIDYSIHVITHYDHSFKETGSIKEALSNTITVSGKAIFINVLSVAAGFLVLLFSQMVPLQNFGLLVAISMFGSGFGALSLLPVILILVNKAKK